MTFPRRAGLLPALALVTLTALVPASANAQTAAAASKPQAPNGKIVFQSTQGGDGFTNDIYVMDADGKRQTRLTDSTSDDISPVWSPQGDKIAFLSIRGGNGYELFLMNADGSNQRPLRATPVVPFGSFVWSPDGTRLAYRSGDDIHVVEAVAPGGGDSTAAPVNISTARPAGSIDLEPSWAPGGGRLVVRNAPNCPGCSDLYTVNADGTGRTQVTFTPTNADANPRWSPVGEQIAYESFRDGGRHIYVVNADGSGQEVKVSGAVESFGTATWSADGTRLAFVSGIGSNVYAVGADGSGLTQLSDFNASGSVFWSPDCAKVAFHSANGSFVDIHVVNADGSHRASNYTKTRRDDEFASSWQKVP